MRVWLHSFARWEPVLPPPFFEKTAQQGKPFPCWRVLAPLLKVIWPYIWGFISGLFISLVFCLSLHPFNYCSFVVSFLGFFWGVFLLIFFFWLYSVFVAARGLFSGCGGRGLLFIVVHVLLIVVASPCGARALGVWASVVVARGLSSCGVQAQ